MLNKNYSHNKTCDNDLTRTRRVIASRSQQHCAINHQEMINFAGNDYLGLAQHPRILDALISGAREYGFGSASSPMLSGYTRAHQQLEEAFTAFSGRERALFFNSGYHANLGVLTTFANRHSVIIADKHVHASLIDAAALSRARLLRYQHLDHAHAEALLQSNQTTEAILVSESVFSMSGSITNALELAALAKKYHARLIMDDAHGIGILGDHGRGVCEHFEMKNDDISLLVSPFGKAVAGMGAVVSGSHDDIEFLLQHARTYCYSTALPPAVCLANLTALRVIDEEPWRIHHLRHLISFFQHHAARRGLTLISSDLTPIQCIVYGGNQQTLAAQEMLTAHGFFVAAIRPPTVPANTARLRISISATHTEQDILSLLDLLAEHHAAKAS